MKRGLIFDMDGVLIDSGPYHWRSWQQLAEENGLVASEALFQETFGRTNRYILPRFFGRPLSDAEIARYAERKEALYREIIRGTAQPMPGLLPFIDRMRERGWRIAVGSSGPRENVELVLDLFALRSCVQGYTCAEDVTHGKPDPEVFLKAAERIGCAPARCVVVEDALPGLEAARAAGMKCVAITTTNPRARLSGADLVIDSFLELEPKTVEGLVS